MSVRDLLVVDSPDVENPTQADVVLIDRRDSNLVFAQVSPGLVSTPNTGLKVRIVAGYTDDELAEADGLYGSSSDIAIEVIGRLLFLSANVPSVDTTPAGAPAVTTIEVASERQVEELELVGEALFGEVEVSVAETVIVGVDAEVTLGMSYLDAELERADDVAPETAPTPTTDVPATVAGDG